MGPREEIIADFARGCGFPHAGCAPLEPLARASYLEGWLADGRAGEMAWLARRPEERVDPRRRFPWARGIICLLHPYRPPPAPPEDWRTTLRGRIAAYAAGTDYHQRVAARLAALADRLAGAFPGARFRGYVDTGPLLEREWAAVAGLGWIGRNTLLLHRTAGSYFLLAELLTDLVLDPVPLPPDRCGTCTRCVRACPTAALEAGYTMDPRRCLAYLTIEHRGAIPPALRPALENWVFGCDVCQEVCPWNGEARDAAGTSELTPHLPALLALDANGFRARFGRSAVARTRRRGLLRNAAVALGNSGNLDAVPPLTAALDDPEPLVRGHAAWALGRLGGRRARAALEAAARREPDAEAGAEIAAALAGAEPSDDARR
ncbi:MAG TPA: tRNA epoxyqueuosine(34) reductase QueG [Candidatus Binatia bacterium]|nr:tRNA epoxyqueuosine(34) reductase QueG [Candidatus Binatia bacterium]